jgi:hypothetical protein
MVDGKICIQCDEHEQRGNSDLPSNFSNHLILSLHGMFRTASVVIRLALQISSAVLSPALLLLTAPSADMSELAASVKRKASSCLSK